MYSQEEEAYQEAYLQLLETGSLQKKKIFENDLEVLHGKRKKKNIFGSKRSKKAQPEPLIFEPEHFISTIHAIREDQESISNVLQPSEGTDQSPVQKLATSRYKDIDKKEESNDPGNNNFSKVLLEPSKVQECVKEHINYDSKVDDDHKEANEADSKDQKITQKTESNVVNDENDSATVTIEMPDDLATKNNLKREKENSTLADISKILSQNRQTKTSKSHSCCTGNENLSISGFLVIIPFVIALVLYMWYLFYFDK